MRCRRRAITSRRREPGEVPGAAAIAARGRGYPQRREKGEFKMNGEREEG